MSQFVVRDDVSRLTADAHSSVHSFTYRAPLTGEITATVTDGGFDVSQPTTGRLEVDLDQLKGDDPHTDSEMHRRLDTQRYPRARATIDAVVSNGGDVFHLTGTLTLHGRTQPLEGDATVTLENQVLRATGRILVDVRDFNIKPPSLVILRVQPEIEITIDLTADLTAQ